MSLYYIPLLVRSDRYFVVGLEPGASRKSTGPDWVPDFNFVIPSQDRVFTPLVTIEEPGKTVFNQMAPSGKQDIPLRECHISVLKTDTGFELRFRKQGHLTVEEFQDDESGLRLVYSGDHKRISLGFYKYQVVDSAFNIDISLYDSNGEQFLTQLEFSVVRSSSCQRVVIDFGSEASQLGYRNCGPQSGIVQYDILGNIINQLNQRDKSRNWQREDFLNHEPGQPLLYRSFYAVKKNIAEQDGEGFPYNFSNNPMDDEIRLFITRSEVAATEHQFRDNHEIIPNLKLGIDKSIQLTIGERTEDYNIRTYKKELISAILLRLLRLMISTKADFRQGGIIVTLLVPNIYTQHDVFDLLNELRNKTARMLGSLGISKQSLYVEYETISESDAAFMGYQQTQSSETRLANGDMALVIDCGKGTTDISMLLADENENYSSFFRTGFAGAGNVLTYGLAEDFLTLVLKTIPGNNNRSVKDFFTRHILNQHLTTDVLGFIELMENQKKNFKDQQALSITEFSRLAEYSTSTERTIGNLHKDPATLLQYTTAILNDRRIRWDDEVTGLVAKSTRCLAHCIIASIRDVLTKDIRKKVKMVMLTGRAFYFDALKVEVETGLKKLLGDSININMVKPGRAINNKNVAIFGAFTGAYKITDFTGIPIDKKEGVSKNRDVLNNNEYLYRGIKIQPDNDILYNSAMVKRNHQEIKAFRHKTVDIYFTRDNIYLRLMENQRVVDVRTLYSILTSNAELYAPIQDLKAISLFPEYTGDLASIDTVHKDIVKEKEFVVVNPVRRKTVLQFFQF